MKTADNGGGSTCLQYDLLHRLTLKTYNGLNSAVTPSKTFVYDSSTNGNINCPTGSDRLGRLAEVSTGNAGIYGGTDEGFCYDVVGNPTDYFQNDGNAWTHSVESYYPNGIPKTLSIGTQPAITYGLDSMARIYSANASSGQNPILTSVGYDTAGLPTDVELGSGDSSIYGWLNGVGPMNSATFNVGSGSATNTLTWNANGTLQHLAITDTLNTADAQTCTYTYDDLQRLLTDNCGSTVWNQTFSYDPFGNVTKSGNPGSSWSPGYDQTNNRYLLADTTYDANGRLTEDSFDDPIGWDIDGNIVTQTGTSFAYDGLGRTAGSVVGGVWTNYFYAPDGGLMGTVANNGAIQKMFVPLPMSTAVYSGGSLQQYRRNDWQGSVRVASTPSKTLFSGTAYGSFGEPYAPKGTTNNQFAGLTSDIASGTEQVSLSRRYHPGQGRWISPDGAIPNILNPQTFNAYHYATNQPTNRIDPAGNVDLPDGGDSLFGGASDGLFGWLSGGIAPNPGSTPTFMVDGVNTPASIALGLLSSGAGVACPNGDCGLGTATPFQCVGSVCGYMSNQYVSTHENEVNGQLLTNSQYQAYLAVTYASQIAGQYNRLSGNLSALFGASASADPNDPNIVGGHANFGLTCDDLTVCGPGRYDFGIHVEYGSGGNLVVHDDTVSPWISPFSFSNVNPINFLEHGFVDLFGGTLCGCVFSH